MHRFILSIFMMVAARAAAQEDDLSEAIGLDSATELQEASGLEDGLTANSQAPVAAPSPFADWKHTSSIKASWIGTKTEGPRTSDDGLWRLEAASNVHVPLGDTTNIFADAQGFAENASQDEITPTAKLNQLGITVRPWDWLVTLVGKERTSKSPTLFFAPSDFLNAQKRVPGLDEERSGVWQARMSAQFQNHSFDIIHLPVASERSNGFLPDTIEQRGNAARYFGHFSGGIDLELSLGHFAEHQQNVGLFVQALPFKVWKTYLDLGQQRDKDQTLASSHVFGLGYEGFSKGTLRAEYIHLGEKWPALLPTFRQKDFMALSAQMSEWLGRYNIIGTVTRSAEDFELLTVLKGEFIANNHLVIGITAGQLRSRSPASPVSGATTEIKQTSGVIDAKYAF